MIEYIKPCVAYPQPLITRFVMFMSTIVFDYKNTLRLGLNQHTVILASYSWLLVASSIVEFLDNRQEAVKSQRENNIHSSEIVWIFYTKCFICLSTSSTCDTGEWAHSRSLIGWPCATSGVPATRFNLGSPFSEPCLRTSLPLRGRRRTSHVMGMIEF